jgi:hypothetical protein
MIEADITYQISDILNRLWDLQQWWASVSFGVLVVAYLVGKQMNGVLVCILLLLYIIYSVYMWDLLGVNAKILFAYIGDLQKLSDSGVELSAGATAYLLPARLGVFFAPVALLGTFISVVCYTLYVFFRREDREAA